MLKKIDSIPLLAIVALNLVLKLGLFCYISPWEKQIETTKILVSDSKGYEQVAENLIYHHSFAPSKDTIKLSAFTESLAPSYLMWYPDGWMMPAYPVFIAAIYSITGIKPYIVIFVQILLSLISVVLVFRICILVFENKRISTIAALLFAIDFHSIYMANEMLTDTLFSLLFLLSIYYFLKGMQNGKLPIFYIGALFMGLACLTRLLVLIYPVILIVILLVFCKQTIRWKFKAILSYFLVLSIVSGIWSFRNYNQYGRFQLTTHGGWTLLFYYASFTKQKVTHENLDSVRVSFQREADSLGFRKSNNIFDQSEIYKKVASNYIREHKGIYIVTNLKGCINMFLALGNMGMATTFGWNSKIPQESFAEVSVQRVMKNFSINIRETLLGILILVVLAIQYFGAIYGIIKLFSNRNFMIVSLILLTVFYFAGVSGVLGTYRFKLPIIPFICIAAGYGYANLNSVKRENVRNYTKVV